MKMDSDHDETPAQRNEKFHHDKETEEF